VQAPAAPAEPAPAAPAPTAPESAEPAPQRAAEPVVVATTSRARERQAANGRPDSSKQSERDRPTAVDKVKPLPVLSDMGPLAEGIRDRATDAAPPIAVAALALLALALTSGAFVLVAARRAGAWRG
jgi:translation initiation factor IF-2